MSGAAVAPFVSRSERAEREAAAGLVDLVNRLSADDVAFFRRTLLDRLEPVATPSTDIPWRYAMLSEADVARVWDAIERLPARDRPRMVDRVFKVVLLNLRPDTGEVRLTRDQIAAKIGCPPSRVSEAMSVLVRLGVIEREMQRIPNMRGPGAVQYSINANVAWNGKLKLRAERAAQAAQPSLSLVGSE